MERYTLAQFHQDVADNREFEFMVDGRPYSLSYSADGYIFTDTASQVYAVYPSYAALLSSVRIQGRAIEDIIADAAYTDLSVF